MSGIYQACGEPPPQLRSEAFCIPSRELHANLREAIQSLSGARKLLSPVALRFNKNKRKRRREPLGQGDINKNKKEKIDYFSSEKGACAIRSAFAADKSRS